MAPGGFENVLWNEAAKSPLVITIVLLDSLDDVNIVCLQSLQ